MTSKLIYVAGAISGDIEINCRRAINVAARLHAAGVANICPHEQVDHYHHLDKPYEYWIEADLVMLRRCDAIQLTSGWEKSKGINVEKTKAHQLQKPIYFIDSFTLNKTGQ